MEFVKAHGHGNDFVVLDLRGGAPALGAAAAARIADRRLGVGCDQVLTLEPPRAGGAARMGVRNRDGSASAACGNGARAAARLLMEESGADETTLEAGGRLLRARRAAPSPAAAAAAAAAPWEADGFVELDLGAPETGWRAIPLARALETARIEPEALAAAAGLDPALVPGPASVLSMGNPHVVFALESEAALEALDLEALGRALDASALFPEGVNTQASAPAAGGAARRHRVWERGAGATPSSGSGAAAALVGAARLGRGPRRAAMLQPGGGALETEWGEDGAVRQSGAVCVVLRGRLSRGLLP